MTTLRFRWQQRGEHIHVRVFTAPMHTGTFAKCGDLTFAKEDWRVVRAGLVSAREDLVVQVKHEDEL